jgi:hypothetical protein
MDTFVQTGRYIGKHAETKAAVMWTPDQNFRVKKLAISSQFRFAQDLMLATYVTFYQVDTPRPRAEYR